MGSRNYKPFERCFFLALCYSAAGQTESAMSEVSEPSESPSPYMDTSNDTLAVEAEEEMEETEEIEPPPAAVPFSKLFVCADRLDWVLMVVGSVATAAHGTALVIYLHYLAKIVQLLARGGADAEADVLFYRFKEVSRFGGLKRGDGEVKRH
ncbi:putative ABC transporter type 1, transmembrane domain superfamily [Helianthus anomalus]